METLLETNNIVLLSRVQALLEDADTDYVVLDQHMSVLEGSIGAIPRRVMVRSEQLNLARKLLVDAGLGKELPTGE